LLILTRENIRLRGPAIFIQTTQDCNYDVASTCKRYAQGFIAIQTHIPIKKAPEMRTGLRPS